MKKFLLAAVLSVASLSVLMAGSVNNIQTLDTFQRNKLLLEILGTNGVVTSGSVSAAGAAMLGSNNWFTGTSNTFNGIFQIVNSGLLNLRVDDTAVVFWPGIAAPKITQVNSDTNASWTFGGSGGSRVLYGTYAGQLISNININTPSLTATTTTNGTLVNNSSSTFNSTTNTFAAADVTGNFSVGGSANISSNAAPWNMVACPWVSGDGTAFTNIYGSRGTLQVTVVLPRAFGNGEAVLSGSVTSPSYTRSFTNSSSIAAGSSVESFSVEYKVDPLGIVLFGNDTDNQGRLNPNESFFFY